MEKSHVVTSQPLPSPSNHADKDWWRSSVTYQIYPRSFRDSTGSGIGDLRGIISGLDYIKSLGVDAIWLSPFYPSPQVDAGYDISDYTDVDPLFGDLEDVDAMIHEAHARDLRVIIDLVPNHSSNMHPLFLAALASPSGSEARSVYHFVDGRGEHGEEPPNNWRSVFGGPSWTRVTEADGKPGQWYYHLFAAEQPDFNWENPVVLEFFEGVLRFWLDRGVDGFRIDVSDALIKDTNWPDTETGLPVIPKEEGSPVHDVYRRFREILDEYPGDRMAVIETGAPDDVVALFLRRDELHQAFNLRFLKTPWDGERLANAIDESLAANEDVGAPTTWVVENHDNPRGPTRYVTDMHLTGEYVPDINRAAPTSEDDFALGTLRSRAIALLLLALPGAAYMYAGQELGLPQVTDLPDEVLTDPVFFRTKGKQRGRDGCRVPLPWSGDQPPFGFSPPCAGTVGSSPAGRQPWLPQPSNWASLTAEIQEDDETSMLNWFRHLLRLRRAEPALGRGELQWIQRPAPGPGSGTAPTTASDTGGDTTTVTTSSNTGADTTTVSTSSNTGADTTTVTTDPQAEEIGFHFRLTPPTSHPAARTLDVVVNFGSRPQSLPDGRVLALSAPLVKGLLPPDSAAIIAVEES